MSILTRIGVLAAVFVIASVATGFSAALAISNKGTPSFLSHVWSATMQFGWSAGVMISALFWLIYLRKGRDNPNTREPNARQ